MQMRSHTQPQTHHCGPGMWSSTPPHPRGEEGLLRLWRREGMNCQAELWEKVWWESEGWTDDNDRWKTGVRNDILTPRLGPQFSLCRKDQPKHRSRKHPKRPNLKGHGQQLDGTYHQDHTAVRESWIDDRTGVRTLVWSPWLYLWLSTWSQANHLTFLDLSFLISKISREDSAVTDFLFRSDILHCYFWRRVELTLPHNSSGIHFSLPSGPGLHRVTGSVTSSTHQLKDRGQITPSLFASVSLSTKQG